MSKLLQKFLIRAKKYNKIEFDNKNVTYIIV